MPKQYGGKRPSSLGNYKVCADPTASRARISDVVKRAATELRNYGILNIQRLFRIVIEQWLTE